MSSVPTDATDIARTPPGVSMEVRSDAEVMQQVASGNRAAFAQIATVFQDRIYNAMRKMTGNEDDAADLTQETFARAIDHAGSFRNESSAYTWLFRIALNLANTRLRQVKQRKTVAAGQFASKNNDSRTDILDDRPARTQTPDEVVQKREQNEQVMAALHRLPSEQRSLLVLRDVEGMEYQQIAELLAVPLGTLKSRLFRARMALRDELKSYFDGQEVAA